MKIHSICVVKNEADIIEQTIKAAINWSDFIYVFDNGSIDGTWEKVLELAKTYQQVIFYKQDDCTYHNGLRQEVFQHFQDQSSEGDWWCQLDADEIYIDNPRIFLAKIPEKFQTVWAASFQYYFTERDLEKYELEPAFYTDDIPIEQKCRYYLNNWSEARFFKYDKDLIWDINRRWPYTGAVYPVRVRLKHYPHRSPQQIQNRIKLRLQARAKGSKSFRHEAEFETSNNSSKSTLQLTGNEWREKIARAAELNYDAGDNKYLLREDLMPKLPLLPPPILLNKTRILKKYVNRMNFKKIMRTLKLTSK